MFRCSQDQRDRDLVISTFVLSLSHGLSASAFFCLIVHKTESLSCTHPVDWSAPLQLSRDAPCRSRRPTRFQRTRQRHRSYSPASCSQFAPGPRSRFRPTSPTEWERRCTGGQPGALRCTTQGPAFAEIFRGVGIRRRPLQLFVPSDDGASTTVPGVCEVRLRRSERTMRGFCRAVGSTAA